MSEEIKKRKEELEEFKELINPVMKYLAENHHPHMHITITANSAEMSEGVKAYQTNEFIVD